MVYELLGIGSLDEDFTHVGNVEHPDFSPYGDMFRCDAGILDRHHETREGAHLGPESDMLVVQACVFEILFHLVISCFCICQSHSGKALAPK